MKSLIIIFNKIESCDSFNEIKNGIPIKELMFECDNKTGKVTKGFAQLGDHFHRLLPEQSIIGNTFSTNSQGFRNLQVEHSEILLIQLSNKIFKWKLNFREDFEKYTSEFERVYISYHRSDVKRGKHTQIEALLNSTPIKTENYHHEYEYGIENKEQLYGFLAKAIVKYNGGFTKEAYDNTIQKLISFFPLDEEIRKQVDNELKNKVFSKILEGLYTDFDDHEKTIFIEGNEESRLLKAYKLNNKGQLIIEKDIDKFKFLNRLKESLGI